MTARRGAGSGRRTEWKERAGAIDAMIAWNWKGWVDRLVAGRYGTVVTAVSDSYSTLDIFYSLQETIMGKVYPYHSTSSEDHYVHHDNDNCPAGKQIKEENKRLGEGGRPLCEQCRKM
jgi:hypothetical protein